MTVVEAAPSDKVAAPAPPKKKRRARAGGGARSGEAGWFAKITDRKSVV